MTSACAIAAAPSTRRAGRTSGREHQRARIAHELPAGDRDRVPEQREHREFLVHSLISMEGGSSLRSSSQATPMRSPIPSSARRQLPYFENARQARAMIDVDLRDARAGVAKDRGQVAVHAAKRHEVLDELAPEDFLRATRVAHAHRPAPPGESHWRCATRRGGSRYRAAGRDSRRRRRSARARSTATRAAKAGRIVLAVAVHEADERLRRRAQPVIDGGALALVRAKRSPRTCGAAPIIAQVSSVLPSSTAMISASGRQARNSARTLETSGPSS